MKHDVVALERAARWAGITLTPSQSEELLRFADWLVQEAIPAGAVGPDESDRIVDRHIADSLVFAAGWDQAPDTLVDVGSGAGLPGIPLAIALPGTAVTLLDRSRRKADLLRRAVRVFEVDNAMVRQADAEALLPGYTAATFRASMPPAAAIGLVPQLVLPRGVAMIGLHRGVDPPSLPESPPGAVLELLETPAGVLDSPAWHLRMTLR